MRSPRTYRTNKVTGDVFPLFGKQTTMSQFQNINAENESRKQVAQQLANMINAKPTVITTKDDAVLVQPTIVKTASITEVVEEKPQNFKTYAEGGRYFEVSESDFIKHQKERDYANIKGNVKYFEQLLNEVGIDAATLKPDFSNMPSRGKGRDAAMGYLGNKRRLETFDSETNRKYRDQKAHEAYIEQVKKAISKGEPVPEAVIKQYPEFRKAKDARLRYEKGLHTSFANKSAAVNAVMQLELGYKVKRQDGTPITEEQIKEIEDGVNTITQAVGSTKDIMLKSDLTIAHTSGKYPFLTSNAAGLFSPKERRITIGHPVISALAHEWGHWLDFEAGKNNPDGYVYLPTGKYGSATRVKMERLPLTKGDDELIKQAQSRMNNDNWEVERMMRKADDKRASPEDRKTAREYKAKLGKYWESPIEVWARLVEQYVATEAGKRTHAAMAPEQYHKLPAWWRKEDFDYLKPMVKAEIERRIQIARGQ